MTMQLPTKAEPRSIAIVQDDSPLSFLLDTARFEHMYRIANAMASGSFIPAHIRGPTEKETASNCFRIVNQCLRWGMDPFAVVDETYVVKGRLGYQGKLIAGVINARAGLKTGLRCIYNTKLGDDFAIVVYASEGSIPEASFPHLKKYAEAEDRDALMALTQMGVLAIRLSVAQGKTDNKMWKTDPEQKLFYSGATKWARRHRPEIMLGLVSEDELERLTVESTAPPTGLPPSRTEQVAAKLGAANGQTSTEQTPEPPKADALAAEPVDATEPAQPDSAPETGSFEPGELAAQDAKRAFTAQINDVSDELAKNNVAGQLMGDKALSVEDKQELLAQLDTRWRAVQAPYEAAQGRKRR